MEKGNGGKGALLPFGRAQGSLGSGQVFNVKKRR